jgi:hypothetical protein
VQRGDVGVVRRADDDHVAEGLRIGDRIQPIEHFFNSTPHV